MGTWRFASGSPGTQVDWALRVPGYTGDHFGIKIEPVICSYPEIALDIDEPGDYALAEKFLREDAGEMAAA